MSVFGFCEGNDVGFGVFVEYVLEVEDSSVHASRVECEGCDGGVGIVRWCWCVFCGVCVLYTGRGRDPRVAAAAVRPLEMSMRLCMPITQGLLDGP